MPRRATLNTHVCRRRAQRSVAVWSERPVLADAEAHEDRSGLCYGTAVGRPTRSLFVQLPATTMAGCAAPSSVELMCLSAAPLAVRIRQRQHRYIEETAAALLRARRQLSSHGSSCCDDSPSSTRQIYLDAVSSGSLMLAPPCWLSQLYLLFLRRPNAGTAIPALPPSAAHVHIYGRSI